MGTPSPTSVGLQGDGDELFTIAHVEHTFGVKLDPGDTSHWYTAGDVFASLLKVLPPNIEDDGALWARFTQALSAGTGVDPASIERDSPLLSQSRFWGRVADVSGLLWIVIAASMMALLLWALISS